MPIKRQLLADATQFTGLLGAGLFVFNRLSSLPRSTGIQIGMVAYFEAEDGVVLTVDVEAFAMLSGGDPTDRIPIAVAQSSVALINPITGNAEMRTCSLELPREEGKGGLFWDILLITTGKLETATAFVQYRITPGPETKPGDSLE